jgi:hypothetical protein
MRIMGIFNTIKSDLKCPICKSELEWQSKFLEYDGLPIDTAMITIELRQTMNGEMHTSCDTCKTWLETEIKNGKAIIVLQEPLEKH